jgi:heptosyltransferase-1
VREQLDLRPVLLGAPGDRPAAARIAAGTPIVDLTGRTSLAQAAAIIKSARLVVGVDTGLTHIGVALGRPTVALFGSTRPYLDACRGNASVIWLGLACSPCRRRPTCGGAYTCLREITADRVLRHARQVLAAG